jgi:hypothetical protein
MIILFDDARVAVAAADWCCSRSALNKARFQNFSIQTTYNDAQKIWLEERIERWQFKMENRKLVRWINDHRWDTLDNLSRPSLISRQL